MLTECRHSSVSCYANEDENFFWLSRRLAAPNIKNRPRTRPRPDFARLCRGNPLVFFTTRPGAPKRSDGGLELDHWSLALVQYLALVNPRHSKGSLCGSKDEDEFEFEDDYLLAGTYDPDIKGEARG